VTAIANPWSLLALLPLLMAGAAPAAAQPAGAQPAAPQAPTCASAEAAGRSQQAELLSAAPRLNALLLAETHTSAADHAWQLATLEALARRRPQLALGLEMVPAARQAVLDRYNAGRLDAAQLLQQVGWAEVWGHDPELYLPLLRWARRLGVPLLGLNAEPELVRRVRQQGLAALPPAARVGIGTPAPVGPAYRQQLRDAWQMHRSSTTTAADNADLERFIDSQRLRDRAMAEAIAAAHRREPGRLVVALIGRGHLPPGDGVPRQLQALGLGGVLAAQAPVPPPGCGPAPAGARLGVYLESADGAVWVRQVAPGSAAAAAGLRPGDRIVSVNGEPVQRAGQVIRRVAHQPAGMPLRLTLLRNGRTLTLTLLLSGPGRSGEARIQATAAR
jgi:uncharacterized iron-regulated protein